MQYATAHTGILGTTRPTRYVVLHGESTSFRLFHRASLTNGFPTCDTHPRRRGIPPSLVSLLR